MATPASFESFPVTAASLETGAALRVLGQVLDGIDHTARAGLPAAERLTLVKQARTISRRVEALAVTLVAEADAASASMVAEGTPTTSWLTLDGATSSKEAAQLVFTATDTTRYQPVREAALAGRVGVAQARAIADGMADLPATLSTAQRETAVGLFLDKGSALPAARIKALAPQVLAEVAPDAAPSPDDVLAELDARTRRAYGRRGFSWTSDGDGSVLFKGSLPELAAQPLIRMIQARVESERRAGRDHATDRPNGLPDGNHRTSTPRLDDLRTPDQRRADALLGLVDAWQASRHAPAVAGDRPRIVVTMRESDLRERAEQAGLLPDGSPISAGDLRRLCCDADLTPLVLGSESEILDAGRTVRLVTPEIRRALSQRDGGCAFPGCQTPDARCDAHHILPWWAGGPTALHNLVLLCPHHHGLVEPPRFWNGPPPDRWETQLDHNGHPEFLPPKRRDPNRQPIPGNRSGATTPRPTRPAA